MLIVKSKVSCLKTNMKQRGKCVDVIIFCLSLSQSFSDSSEKIIRDLTKQKGRTELSFCRIEKVNFDRILLTF